MARKILGIDIGCDTLKLALLNGKTVKQTAVVAMPKNLVQEGRVVSPDSMGELIKTAMKENRISCRKAAVLFSNESVYVRNVTMPRMGTEQLLFNLPYEFRDYITDEPKDYLYDYSVIAERTAEEAEGEVEGETPKSGVLDLLAVAAQKTLMADTRYMLKKAGLKLEIAAPSICSFISIIRNLPADVREKTAEYCFLDLGYRSVRIHMFKDDVYQATRILEIGLSALDDVLADAYNVDVHLAHTYLLTNYDDCQSKEVCENAYRSIAVELIRALNFYRFSNPDSQLSNVWFCGGGSQIQALKRAIAENADDLTFHNANELLTERNENTDIAFQAIGIALG